MIFILILLGVFLGNFLYDVLKIYFIKKVEARLKEANMLSMFEDEFK